MYTLSMEAITMTTKIHEHISIQDAADCKRCNPVGYGLHMYRAIIDAGLNPKSSWHYDEFEVYGFGAEAKSSAKDKMRFIEDAGLAACVLFKSNIGYVLNYESNEVNDARLL